MSQQNSGGLGKGLVFMALFGVLLIVGPFFGPKDMIPASSQFLLAGTGLAILLLSALLMVVVRLYRKASATEAFVRTGAGGQKVVIDGGAIVIPVVHSVIDVSLSTMRLDVERKGKDALITGNKLRADVKAEFFIKVQKDEASVLAAATSLGEKAVNPDAVKLLVFQKLEGALRSIAANYTLEELANKRDEFRQGVQSIVVNELAPNGLHLESVTISGLDQTPAASLQEENIFDAEGLKTITDVTSRMKVERNALERAAERQIAEQNTATTRATTELEIQRTQIATAAAQQKAALEATAQQAQAEAEAAADRAAQIARTAAERDVDLAAAERDQVVRVRKQQADQAAQEAEIVRTRATEIAGRESQIAVAQAEQRRAAAESERLKEEAIRTEAEAKVATVAAEAIAERDKNVALIAAEADANKRRINEQVSADVAAYTTTRQANAQAEAAEASARALTVGAQAAKDAALLKAEGETAAAMIPVTIAQRQVDVRQREVEIEGVSLRQQQENAQVSIMRAIVELHINADKEVRIAAAQALGQALGASKMQIWTDTEGLSKMTRAFTEGQALSAGISGVVEGMPGEVKDTAMGGVSQLVTGILAAVKQRTGVDITPEAIARAAESMKPADSK